MDLSAIPPVGGIGPLILAFGVLGAVWGIASDRLAARWPAHEDGSVRRVDWRTLVVIVFGAVALAAVPNRFSDTAERALFGAFFAALVLLMATDLHQRLLPDVVTLPLIVLGAGALIWGGDSLVNRQPMWLAIAGAVAVPLILYALSLPFGEGALGGGDIKFLAAAGLLTGVIRLVLAVFVGAMLSGLAIAGLLAAKRVTLKSYIPFGPFLIIGAVWASLLPATS
jgi:leader peptidase (prepilin peptidase)/N-methyltransferase